MFIHTLNLKTDPTLMAFNSVPAIMAQKQQVIMPTRPSIVLLKQTRERMYEREHAHTDPPSA